MSVNPMKIFQLKGLWGRIISNHPKLPKFAQAVTQNAVREGTVIEISVTTAEGQNYITNFRITAEDMELLEEAVQLMKEMQQ